MTIFNIAIKFVKAGSKTKQNVICDLNIFGIAIKFVKKMGSNIKQNVICCDFKMTVF